MELKHVHSRKRCRNSSLSSSSPNNFVTTNHHQPQQTQNLTTKPTSSSSSSHKVDDDDKVLMLTSSSSSLPSLEVEEASDLPCIIMMDILGRLPIKTLINCKYVCKEWKSLLVESYFHRLYSHHLPTSLILPVVGNSVDTLRNIHIIEEDVCGKFITCQMSLVNTTTLNFDLQELQFQLGNGCNGLICIKEIRTHEPTMVWNPIMGQFVILPKPTTPTTDKVVAGLGFCWRTKRYKVLRVFHKRNNPPSQCQAEVYDLGVGNQWREIGDVPFNIPLKFPGFFTNDSLHWILDYNTNVDGNGNKGINHAHDDINKASKEGNKISSECELICGFDFVEENFKAITPPPIYSYKKNNEYYWSNLGIIVDCLSICAIDAKAFRPDIQVWVMEEYDVPESWALRLSIQDPAVNWWDPYRWIQITNFNRNGGIILLCGHCHVLAYNPKERRYRKIRGSDFPAAVAHVPNLISLEDVLSETLGTGSLRVRYL